MIRIVCRLGLRSMSSRRSTSGVDGDVVGALRVWRSINEDVGVYYHVCNYKSIAAPRLAQMHNQ